ncbi:MAG: DUF1592 domain-containing protein [Polyangiaceae bacterium]
MRANRNGTGGFGTPWMLLGAVLIGCTGFISDPGEERGNGGVGPNVQSTKGDLTAKSGLRRLTAAEYDKTVKDLFGASAQGSELYLPTDPRLPFDNDYATQEPSKALIQGAELLAEDIVASVLADSARLQTIVDCTPTGAADAACFEHFVTRFGRRAFRRSLTSEEVQRFTGALSLSTERNDFYEGVGVVLRAFLQDPNFLYRVEAGTPMADEPGVFRLSATEVATRLSYLLWGSTPSEALLDTAEAGKLESAQQVRDMAQAMLADPRAQTRIQRFHAMWIGYEQSGKGGALAPAMRAETDQLIARVVFEQKAPWRELFSAQETYLTSELAEHYGLAQPSDPAGAWVDYGDSGRRGLLSHASFLGVGVEGEDTSPTLRGVTVLDRLLCEDVPPPPSNVVINPLPPAGSGACKKQRFEAHAQPGCNACHDRTDPIGFGLEQYGMLGEKRDHEPGAPECTIDGEGALLDEGTFNGPGQLSQLIADSDKAANCRVTQLYRFATGRAKLDATDVAFVDRSAASAGKNASLTDLILAIVGSPEFRQRREDAATEGK